MLDVEQRPDAQQVPALIPTPAALPPRTEDGDEVRQVISFGCLRRKGLNDFALENAVEAVPLRSEDQMLRRVAIPGQLGVAVPEDSAVRPELSRPVPPRAGQSTPGENRPAASRSATPGDAPAQSGPSTGTTSLTRTIPEKSPILTHLPVGRATYDLVAAAIFSPKTQTDQTVQVTGVMVRALSVNRINVSTIATLADRCVVENAKKDR
jgi:hypothetical protein